MSHVAALKTYVPNVSSFTVRGTVPLPEGYQYAPDAQCPFTIVSPNGVELTTQWDLVSRYPNGDAAVVKLSAVVPLGSMQPGSQQLFKVKLKPNPPSVMKLSEKMASLLLINNNIRLRITDVHGNVYEEDISNNPLDTKDSRAFKTLEIGPVSLTSEMAGWLHAPGKSENELPYFGGLIWWTTVRNDGSNIVELALDWHNGGSVITLADLYFKTVELVLPLGWSAISEWPEPLMGIAKEENGETVIPLVVPQSDGKMHLMPQFQERLWRLYLHELGNEFVAQEISSKRGWALCIDGVNEDGNRLWNWRNPNTANYYPQRCVTPDLSHFDAASRLNKDKNAQYKELEEGLKWYGFQGAGQMGLWNPAGTSYGGMTGGDEINQWDGIRLIATGEPNGLLLHRAKHRRYTDRAHAALYDSKGSPIVQDDYLKEDGSAPWKCFSNGFIDKKDAPWFFSESSTAQVDFVQSHNLQPDYEQSLKSYYPIDHQHQIRRTKDLKVLIWLDNDPVAKKHLAMQAEWNRMVYAEYNSGAYNKLLSSVINNPHKGGEWGRGDAWNLDCNVSHFAISDDTERDRWRPWMDTVFSILFTMQAPNGIWQRKFGGKTVTEPPFDPGLYSITSPNEHMFSIHTLRAMLKSVYEGHNPIKAAACLNMIFKSIAGMWIFLWKWKKDGSSPDANGPWYRVAIGPLEPESAVWTNHFQHPPEQYEVWVDSHFLASTLGYGLELLMGGFLESTVIAVIETHTQGPALETLIKEGDKFLDSRAHLLALLQEK